MSDPEYDSSYITPEQFMVLVEIEEKGEFVEYLEEDVISYNKKDGQVYFTEQNVIDYLCPDQFWAKEDKPNTIREMNRYKTIDSDWEDIVEQAQEIDVDLSFLEEDEEESKIYEGTQQCLICDDKNIRSKGLCEKHYNRVYYHFEEVTEQSIEAYRQRDTDPDNEWSRDYDQCQRCYTTDREHHAKGYCQKCYYKEYHGVNKKTTA